MKKKQPANIKRGTALNYNAAAQTRYQQALVKLVQQMIPVVEKEIVQLFKSDAANKHFGQDATIASQSRIVMNRLKKQFNDMFGKASTPLAQAMVYDANKSSSSAIKASLKELSSGLTLSTDILTGPLQEIVKSVISTNVNLIKSISADYLGDVEHAVFHSITTGNGLQDLQPFLEQRGEITERRAKNIALDQTRKAFNGINKGRLNQLGVKQFEWLHSGGSQHPRPEHIAMSGNIYGFNNLPVIDSRSGERGIPGQAINCKCRMIPVIKFDEGNIDANDTAH